MVANTSLGCKNAPGYLGLRIPIRYPPTAARPSSGSIADVLSTLDDKIEQNRRMNETLEDYSAVRCSGHGLSISIRCCAKLEGRWRRGDSLPGLYAKDLYGPLPRTGSMGSELGEIPEGWET